MELLHADMRHLTQTVDKLGSRVDSLAGTVDKLGTKVDSLADTTGLLVQVLKLHEQRISDLEGNR